jgi:hypothetical protein
MPVTFTFDFNDPYFAKDMNIFARYFNFINYSTTLITNEVYQSQSEIEMETLIRTAEKNLVEELQKGIKIAKNNSKPVDKVQNSTARPHKLSQLTVTKEAKSQRNCVENKEGKIQSKSDNIQYANDSGEKKEDKEPNIPVLTDSKKKQAAISDLNRLVYLKKGPENPVLDEYRKIIEKLKLFEFKIDLYNFSLQKHKNEEACRINYGAVRIDDCSSVGKNVWILKVAGLNRGFGIEIFSSLDRLRSIIKDISSGYQETIIQNNKKTSRSKGYIKTAKFIIQKYIEKPLLFKDRKFDLRVWVMVTHEFKLHVFRECYVRLSTETYKLDGFHEKFVHLTNNALQKYSSSYSEDETLKNTKELEEYIRESRKMDFSFKAEIWEKIKNIIVLVNKCNIRNSNVSPKNKCFEIFGYDFMIDHDLKVWLIEVNSNPSITMGGKILDAYVPRMIDDAFKLTLDKIFPQPSNQKRSFTENLSSSDPKKDQKLVYKIDGHPDDENLWDMLE